jgi:hypothetical protein
MSSDWQRKVCTGIGVDAQRFGCYNRAMYTGPCDEENNMIRRWLAKFQENHGDFAVPCMTTNRWVEFSREGSCRGIEGEYILLHVMTLDANEQPRRLCELVIVREDLLAVLDLIEKTP